MPVRSSVQRLAFLDWVRGLGALIMLQGHAFDSFTRADLRQGGAFLYSQFVGGMPPAIFLFLTGVTLAFLMDSTTRKGLAPAARVRESLRRAGYLFALAFAFRLQLWAFSQPYSPPSDLLRVDILNCMGFAIALLSPMALCDTKQRARWAGIAGLAIAFAAPLVSLIHWPAAPPLLRSYIAPDYRSFGFFPWGAYLAFGLSAGSIIRAIPKEAMGRVMQWSALLGVALIAASQYFANQPYSIYTKAEFWLNSPAQILTKQGVTLLVLSLAFLWTRRAAADSWSWVRQLGTTSLLVYWVHIELVYGRWLAYWKLNLTVPQTIAAAVAIIALMMTLSLARTNRDRIAGWIADLRWSLTPRPDAASGD